MSVYLFVRLLFNQVDIAMSICMNDYILETIRPSTTKLADNK